MICYLDGNICLIPYCFFGFSTSIWFIKKPSADTMNMNICNTRFSICMHLKRECFFENIQLFFFSHIERVYLKSHLISIMCIAFHVFWFLQNQFILILILFSFHLLQRNRKRLELIFIIRTYEFIVLRIRSRMHTNDLFERNRIKWVIAWLLKT